MWTKYLKVLDIGLQNTFVYRWNFLFRSLFGFVPLIGTVCIWGALFRERKGSVGGYDYTQMIYYFLLTILVNNLVTPTEDEWQIAADIRDGQINSFLTKPMSYLGYRTILFFSYRLLYTVITIVPLLLVFGWFHSYIRLPHEALTWLIFPVSLAMSAFIQFFIAYSLALCAFWILEISTIVFILYSFEYFLSGQTFPLDIMPASFQELLKWLPFTYELFFPVRIFQERINAGELWSGLAIQAGWMLTGYLIARLMWRRGVKHYQAAGG